MLKNIFPAISPEKRSKTLAYYAAFVALGFVLAILGPTLNGLAENTQSSIRLIMIVFSELLDL